MDKDEDGLPIRLGRGLTSIVYQGQYSNSAVAVKEIDSATVKSNELKMYCRLAHPKVIRLFGHYKKNSTLWLVLELGRKSLRELLESHHAEKLLFNKALTFALHISEGIRYLHREGIIHLDIKSPNVIICENDIAKITDFGSARKMEPTSTQSTLGNAARGRYYK